MSATKGNGHDEDLPAVSGTTTTEETEDTSAEPKEGEAGAPEQPTGLVEVPPTAAEVEALRRERDELKETLLRRRADFENLKKRMERERSSSAAEALTVVFRQLVDTVDNLERALAASGTEAGLREGVELTHRELVALLDSHGVTPVDPRGEKFDPLLHQALSHEAVPGVAEGVVAEVFRKGYRFKGRLIRPALVKVSSGTEDGGPDDGGDVF